MSTRVIKLKRVANHTIICEKERVSFRTGPAENELALYRHSDDTVDSEKSAAVRMHKV